MKKIFLSFYMLFSILFSSIIIAQEKEAPPLIHEKKVYTDEVSNEIYWPLDIGFYIWLSPSANESAPKFLLNQEVVNNATNQSEPLTEGIKLEMSGNQFVRWINSVTNGETRLKFFADGNPPEISDSLYGSPRYKSDTATYFGKGLQLKIKSYDQLSGVYKSYCSIDGKEFVEYQQPLSLNKQKAYNIRYYAVDNTGYANEPVPIDLIVDLDSPVTELSTENNFHENTLSKETKIVLAGKDNSSGIRQTFYKFDDTDTYSVFGKSIAIAKLKNGEHQIHYYSKDKVENEEAVKTYSFYLDKEPPEPEISIRGEQFENESGFYVSALSLINIKASDDKIGVNKIYYAINQSADFLVYENPFPLSLKSGDFSISFYAVDKLGNTSARQKKYYRMDLTPPVTGNKIDGPHYSQRSTVWITKDTRLALTAEDAASGLRETHYIIGDKQPVVYDNTPVSIETEGNYLFRYFSYDNVGNREGDNVLLLIADNSPPEIKEIFSVSPVDTLQKKGLEVLAYPQYTTLFLAATDMSSGLQGVWYTVNKEAEQEYFNSILCDKIGEYSIKVRAVDNLGHTTEKQIDFVIKKLEVNY